MPLRLRGSCRCGAIRFAVDSHTPQPYQLCYCSICRKSAGVGGYAINLGAVASSLIVEGTHEPSVFHATIEAADAPAARSPAGRRFCGRCGAALWLFDPRWPELLHPFASAIDSSLPVPPSRTHIMLGSRADWVVPRIEPGDLAFDGYPDDSIDDWHRARGLWVP